MPEAYISEHPFQRRLVALLPVGMLITLLAFGLAGYTLISRSDEAAKARQRVCRVANGDRLVLRQLLTLAQTSSTASLKDDPVQRAKAEAFYVQALSLVKPVDCTNL